MDEPAGAGVLVDAGPSGLHGTIGASITTGVVEQGAVAHRFSTVAPDTSPVDHGRLDVVANDARLNPGTQDFAMTVRLRTDEPAGQRGAEGPFFDPRRLHEDRHGRRPGGLWRAYRGGRGAGTAVRPEHRGPGVA